MALSVFAGSLVVLGFAVPETRLIAPIACAPLQLASGSRVALPLQCVAHVPSEEAAARESSQQLAEHLLAGVERALSDRRRIDELVAFFEYGGIVELDGKPSFEGQGAVKRFLTALLVDLEVRKVSQDEAAVSVTLTDPTGRSRELLLHPHAQSDKPGAGGIVLISELRVSERDGASGHDASALFAEHFGARGVGDGARVGPKWETFDGRVRQRIWQHADVFSPGNRFLVKTMELMTDRLIMIVDQTVWQLYGDKMQAWAESVDLRLDAIVAPGNEDQKTLGTFTFMLDELKEADPLRRSEPVLAVGGGVLTDTAGFACACWRRGIPWCRLPTTLLGMVDASVGIKVAINYHRKNGVGHFFSPSHTFIDPSFLGTVSTADIRSGVGEIMKAALIHDGRLYELMERHGERLIEERFQSSDEASRVIKLSIDAMLECIGPDLWEEALLRPMDFGHTFSRTLEADERFYLRHGEAVAIDCIMSALIAERKGILPTAQADSLLRLYARLGLPCSIKGVSAATYKKARDEIVVHRDGLLRAPMPAGIGTCEYVDEMTDDEIDDAFARLERFMEANPSTMWDPSKSFAAAYADEGGGTAEAPGEDV